MTRALYTLVFVGVFVAVLGGTHYYFWARLVRDTALPSPWRAVATSTLLGLGAMLPLALLLGRAFPSVQRVLAWPAFVWMGLMLLLFLALAVGDVVRLVASLATHPDPERRRLLARILGGAAATTAAGLGLFSIVRARQPLVVKEVPVDLPRLPAALDGSSIVQITDVHVGPTIGRAFIEDMVARVNALQPDVIAITGDLVDGPVDALRSAVAPLGDLKARHGVYFVSGIL